jgi:hypothetical protein
MVELFEPHDLIPHSGMIMFEIATRTRVVVPDHKQRALFRDDDDRAGERE